MQLLVILFVWRCALKIKEKAYRAKDKDEANRAKDINIKRTVPCSYVTMFIEN